MNGWQDEVKKVLRPLLMCSVEQRYQLFMSTEFGKKVVDYLDLQGSVRNVMENVIKFLSKVTDSEKEFLAEFSKLPKPEWYKE